MKRRRQPQRWTSTCRHATVTRHHHNHQQHRPHSTHAVRTVSPALGYQRRRRRRPHNTVSTTVNNNHHKSQRTPPANAPARPTVATHCPPSMSQVWSNTPGEKHQLNTGQIRWLYPFPPYRFHVLFNSLFKVLCNFPSQYLFAIGFVGVFSLR